MTEAEVFISKFKLERHPEGGWFSEQYTTGPEAGTVQNGRPLAGSIYFLLNESEISHFHVIDCEEIWYFHSGCGLRVWQIAPDGTISESLLGKDANNGQLPMVILPKGVIFAAENLDKSSYTFVSCVTVPKFRYDGFHLLTKAEAAALHPSVKTLRDDLFI